MIIKIKDLRLRAIIGIHEWERKNKQDIIINVEFEFNGSHAAQSDNIDDTVNYKGICKNIIELAENSEFNLLEKLCDKVLQIVMKDHRVKKGKVEIEKPHALRFADSVSVTQFSEGY